MVDRIIFLCTGNICRSPLAEVIAAQKFRAHGLSFCSAGLEAVDGLPASGASAEYAAAHGLTLAAHRSQPVTPGLLADAAWAIGMTRSHAAIFRSRHGDAYNGAVGILGAPGVDLAQQIYSPEAEEVNDPYGLARERYFECGDQISRLLEGWTSTFTALQGAGGTGSGQETRK